MSINKPLVSIIIPCYNHEQFLDDCMWGLLKQTYDNMELLICDDHSDDSSYEKICSYKERLAERFKRVVLKQNETNLGITRNLNRMLKEAKGEFIKIIASDDVLFPNAINEYIDNATKDDNICVYVSNGKKIKESSCAPDFEVLCSVYEAAPEFKRDNMIEQLTDSNPIFAPGVFMPYEIYEKCGFYDEQIAIEDLEYWMRIVTRSLYEFRYVNKPLVYYRLNENSVSSQAVNKKLEKRRMVLHTAEMEIIEKYRSYMDKRMYAKIYLEKINNEWVLANVNKLDNMKKLLKSEVYSKNIWNCLSIKDAFTYTFRFIKRYLGR